MLVDYKVRGLEPWDDEPQGPSISQPLPSAVKRPQEEVGPLIGIVNSTFSFSLPGCCWVLWYIIINECSIQRHIIHMTSNVMLMTETKTLSSLLAEADDIACDSDSGVHTCIMSYNWFYTFEEFWIVMNKYSTVYIEIFDLSNISSLHLGSHTSHARWAPLQHPNTITRTRQSWASNAVDHQSRGQSDHSVPRTTRGTHTSSTYRPTTLMQTTTWVTHGVVTSSFDLERFCHVFSRRQVLLFTEGNYQYTTSRSLKQQIRG